MDYISPSRAPCLHQTVYVLAMMSCQLYVLQMSSPILYFDFTLIDISWLIEVIVFMKKTLSMLSIKNSAVFFT